MFDFGYENLRRLKGDSKMPLYRHVHVPGDVRIRVSRKEIAIAEGGIGPAFVRYLYDLVSARNRFENDIGGLDGLVAVGGDAFTFYRPKVTLARDAMTDGLFVHLHYVLLSDVEVAALVIKLWGSLPSSIQSEIDLQGSILETMMGLSFATN